MDFQSILDNIISLVLGSGAGWFFTRKKYNAETAVTQGEAMQLMQTAYKTMVDDTNVKLEEMRKEIADLHEEISKLRIELEKCMNKSKSPSKSE